VRRLWDEKNQALIYVTYSRQVTDASAKVDISSVALRGQEVTWRP
jgi:CreA protein